MTSKYSGSRENIKYLNLETLELLQNKHKLLFALRKKELVVLVLAYYHGEKLWSREF